MVAHVNPQMENSLIVFVDFSARLNAMYKLFGIINNMKQATAHKPVEIFFKLIFVLFPGDAALSRCTFLAMINNLKLTKINGKKNKAMKVIKYTVITKPFLEIV